MLNVRHSGAIGDILYSLPYLKSLKKDICFYIGEHSATSGIIRTPLMQQDVNYLQQLFPKSKYIVDPNHTVYNSLKRLLEMQPFIVDVKPEAEVNEIDIDLNKFRVTWNHNYHIVDNVFIAFNTKRKWKDAPFIHNIPIDEQLLNSCVCARSPRYRNINGDNLWLEKINEIKNIVDRIVFVGIEREYEDLVSIIDNVNIQYLRTEDLYDVAVVINSCKFGIYNGSAPLAIATGLYKERFVESPYPEICRTTIFSGADNEHFFG